MTGIIGTADTSAMIILRAAPTTRLLPVLLLAILVFAFIGQGQGLLDDSCCSALLVSKRRGVVPEDSGLPVLMITTPPGVKIVDEPKVAAKLCVCLPGNQVAASGEARARSAASVVYDGPIGIEVRGQSSQRHEKKSWAVELRDEWGNDVKQSLLGMPADDDWVLIGAETDRTLGLRNYMAYECFRSGMGRYASRVAFVEVFLANEDAEEDSWEEYRGLYLLGEKVKSSPERVPISDYDELGDRSGGYILKYDNDNIDEGDVVFKSSASGLSFVMVEPKADKPGSSGALPWIKGWISGMERDLKALKGPSDSLQSALKEHCLALDAFVDYFLLVELTKNPDGYRGSAYMHKDRGSCLSMGPVWDYDEAFGLCCGFPFEGYQNGGSHAINPEGWRFSICDDPEMCLFDPVDGISWWYRAAWKTDEFRASAAQRWKQLRQHGLSSSAVLDKFDEAAALISSAAARNYKRWSSVIFSQGFDNGMAQWEYYVSDMRQWIEARLAWMDSALEEANPY